MLQTKWWRIAVVAGLGLLAGAAAGRAASAGTCPTFRRTKSRRNVSEAPIP